MTNDQYSWRPKYVSKLFIIETSFLRHRLVHNLDNSQWIARDVLTLGAACENVANARYSSKLKYT